MICSVVKQASGTSHSSVFARRMEIKYVIDRTIRAALTGDLAAMMRPDPHAGPNGVYRIRSLYFDTPSFMAYHQKMDGAATRHKLRIRAYGDDPGAAQMVRLEVKSRYLQFIHKITIDVPRDEYPALHESLRQRTLPALRWLSNPRISPEFFRIQRQYNMEPKVVVQYRREALEHRSVNRLRVNLDDELYASAHLDLLGPLVAPRRLLRYGHCVFEIKADGSIPSWLHMLIAKYNLQNRTFSKYCYALYGTAALSSVARGPGASLADD